MKSIEERAKEAGVVCQYKSDYPYDKKSVEFGYMTGATEQKAIDEEVRLKKCDDMTEAEYDRDVAFADWYNKNGKGIPTYSDAIEWARRELIDKACKCFCKTCRGQCKDNSHCDVFQVFRNELNAMEE